MGKIIVSENVSLDGVIQDPAGDEGFRHGGWIGRIGDRGRDEAARVALEEALGTEAMLLGRRSYEFLAARKAASRQGRPANAGECRRPRDLVTAGPVVQRSRCHRFHPGRLSTYP